MVARVINIVKEIEDWINKQRISELLKEENFTDRATFRFLSRCSCVNVLICKVGIAKRLRYPDPPW